jgi:hypothetical protein
MLGFGVWYLGFGSGWIARFSGSDNIDRSSNSLKPVVTGTQVYNSLAFTYLQIGLIALTMILTQISATALQNKEGLPFGNQLLGWTVLGIFFDGVYDSQ